MLEASHPEELEQRRREDEEEAKIAAEGIPGGSKTLLIMILNENVPMKTGGWTIYPFLLVCWPIAGSVLGGVD